MAERFEMLKENRIVDRTIKKTNRIEHYRASSNLKNKSHWINRSSSIPMDAFPDQHINKRTEQFRVRPEHL